MDHTQVLIHTAKGKEEIRTKAFQLPPRLRRLLPLVNGESTVGATLARLAVLGEDIESELDSLLADGFLAPRQSGLELGTFGFDDWQTLADLHRAPPTRAPAGPERPERPRFNLEKAKGFARFVVLGYLGPVGAYRVERIDAARNAGELRAELRDLGDILPKLLHKRQAQRAWDQLEPLMLASDSPGPTWETGPDRRDRAPVRSGATAQAAFAAAVQAPDDGPGDESMPAALAAQIRRYAEPLTDAAVGREAQRRALQTAIVCWNVAMLPDNRGLETVAPTLRAIAGGDRRCERALFDIFAIMRARKHAHFQADNRFIVEFSLADTPDGLQLILVSRLLCPGRAGAATASA